MILRPFLKPVAFYVGPWPVHWYGIILASCILLGAFLAMREAQRRGEDPERVWDAVLLVIIAGLIGARVYHVIHEWNALYKDNPVAVFYIWNGGLAIYGALVGGVLAFVLYARSARLNVLRWLDIAAPGIALAQAIGRWGNFFNQELYGLPTNGPLAVFIEPEYRLPGYEGYELFHPLFLYESLWNLFVFGVLVYLTRRSRLRLLDGDVFFLYLILYSVGRIPLEAVKIGDVWTVWGIRTAQLVGMILIVVSVIAMAYRRKAA